MKLLQGEGDKYDRAMKSALFTGLGLSYVLVGEQQKGFGYLNQALQLNHDLRDKVSEAQVLNAIGATYSQIGQKQKALDYYNQALPIARQIEDNLAIATVLNNTGDIYRKQGEHQKALDFYRQALAMIRSIGDREKEAATLGNIANSERALGNLAEARTQVESAIAIAESLRTNVVSRDLRASYFARAQGYFDFDIDLLMSLYKLHPTEGYDALALQMAERASARSLLESLVEANADIRQGVNAQLLERERSLRQQLNAKALAQVRLRTIPNAKEQAAMLSAEMNSTINELQQVEMQIRQNSPRYAELTQPRPLTLSEIQTQVLDKETLLLEFSLGEERSYLWAVTQNSITSYELPKRAEIEATARLAYDALMDDKQWVATGSKGASGSSNALGQISCPEAVTRLSRMLLSPVASEIGKKRLLIVSDGVLQYIPFGALPVPATGDVQKEYLPLITEHEIVSLPSASTLAVLRREMKDRKPAEKSLFVLADPVFEPNDERIKSKESAQAKVKSERRSSVDQTREALSPLERSSRESGVREGDGNLKRLPWTRREAEQISALLPASERKQAVDFEASRMTATSAELAAYRYVHFATHGFLNSLRPELSGLALTMFDERGTPEDGFLRAHEIFNLKLNADLVVLSACRTGMGKNIRGEGLIGLTRGFMYAGAPRVVVSLWSVSDNSTAELMTRFYRGMIEGKLSPSKALQEAEISMFNDKRFRAPFFWAAFIIQGEWR